MKWVRLLIVAVALVAAGCSLQSIYTGDFFYLESGGQYMPVWVVGNTASRLFVVILHGGPGLSAMGMRAGFSPFLDLEGQYAFVYWDQPYSGSTQGSGHPSPFSVDLAVSDTEKIVGLIKARYSDPKIVLFGHSWGGALGTAYLLDPTREAGISGWIEMDGSHNMPLANELSRQFVIDYATGLIADPTTTSNERARWQSIREWYMKNPVINGTNALQHDEYVKLAHGDLPEGESIDTSHYLEVLAGPFDLSSLTVNNLSTALPFLSMPVATNYSSQMSRITVPALILWGAKDGLIPAPLAQDAYDHLGSTQKKVVIFPNSGHSPVATDFPLMESALKEFLGSL